MHIIPYPKIYNQFGHPSREHNKKYKGAKLDKNYLLRIRGRVATTASKQNVFLLEF